MKLNDKITYLSNEIEIKQSKIDFIDKRHKNLQIKYLKVLGEKRKMTQDNLPIFKYNKDKEKELDAFSEMNSARESTYVDYIKGYNTIKKNEHLNRKNKTIEKGKNKTKTIKKNAYEKLHLPEIKNNNKSVSLHKNDNNKNNKSISKDVKNNNALKDLNMLLSDYSGERGEKKNEELEEEGEYEEEENENSNEI